MEIMLADALLMIEMVAIKIKIEHSMFGSFDSKLLKSKFLSFSLSNSF